MNEWPIPTLHLERCTGCGLCVQYCPPHAVEMIAGRPVIARPADCAYCGLCEEICPQTAIELEYEILGECDEATNCEN